MTKFVCESYNKVLGNVWMDFHLEGQAIPLCGCGTELKLI